MFTVTSPFLAITNYTQYCSVISYSRLFSIANSQFFKLSAFVQLYRYSLTSVTTKYISQREKNPTTNNVKYLTTLKTKHLAAQALQ